MSKYRKRVIEYNEKTQLYIVKVPELGIEFTTDTEASCLPMAREAIENYVVSRSGVVKALETLDGAYDDSSYSFD